MITPSRLEAACDSNCGGTHSKGKKEWVGDRRGAWRRQPGRKRRKGPCCLSLAPVRTLFTVASAALLHQPSSPIAITLEGGGGQGCKGCCNCRSGNMVSCIPYIQMQISVENGNSPGSKNRGSFYHAEVIVCPSCPGLVIVKNMSLEMAQ